MKKSTKIVILMFIALISFLLYFPPFHEKNLEEGDFKFEDCCNLSLTLSSDEIWDKPTFINTIRKITYPFELNYYKIYFQFDLEANSLCYIAYPINLTYVVNNQTKIINKGERELIDILKINEPYNFILSNFTYYFNDPKDHFNYIGVEVPPGQYAETKFTVGEEVDYKLFAKMNGWDATGNMFIFFIFWVGIILISRELIKWFNGKY